jgi:hypothetical protein
VTLANQIDASASVDDTDPPSIRTDGSASIKSKSDRKPESHFISIPTSVAIIPDGFLSYFFFFLSLLFFE